MSERRGLTPRKAPSTAYKKGRSGNPGGMTKEVAALRDALKNSLAKDGPAIHAALMRLVAADNAPAIIYAHQRVFGKPPMAEEDRETMSQLPSRERLLAALDKLCPEE